MPLEGHWQRLHADRTQRSSRERRGFAALVATLVAVGVAVLVIVATADSSDPERGCTDATVASTTGGAQVRACGADARRLLDLGPKTR
jgi:hypothetical protein